MKMIRIFAVVIILLAIVQTALGIWTLFEYDWIAKHLELAKTAGHPIVQGLDIAAWRRNMVATAIVLALVGITSLVSGFGLFRFREWARKLWLAVISFSLVFYGAWFVSDVRSGYLELANWIELFIVITIFGVSWWYFTRPTIRQSFSVQRHG